MLYYNCIEIMQLLDSKWSMIFASYHLMKSHWKWVQTLHSRLREKSSQTKYQKNYPSKSKASFQYLYMRKVHEKILRVCFPTSLGDFGPQSLLISLTRQFFIKQHREVTKTSLSLSFILWVQTLHDNFWNRVDRVIFGHFGPKLGQDWSKIGPNS